jgi:hypothetical protein
MCHTVNRRMGLQRERAMTPREFEQRLVDIGLPSQPVSQLTRLFEAVRYGSREPSQLDEKMAVNCLSEIGSAGGRAE